MIGLKESLDIFTSGRPSMRENNLDLLRLGVLVEAEHTEFSFSLLDYLAHPTQETAQELAQECADVALYLEQILRMIGSDLLTEMLDKIAYNTTRFHSGRFTREPYSDAYFGSKTETKAMEWKQTYYQEPLIIYDHTVTRGL